MTGDYDTLPERGYSLIRFWVYYSTCLAKGYISKFLERLYYPFEKQIITLRLRVDLFT